MGWNSFGKRATAGDKRAKADREIARRARAGEALSPVVCDGVKLGKTFWGKAWCNQVTEFSDRASRLPSGKALVRHRGLIDLKISPGLIEGTVIGNSVFTVKVQVDPVKPAVWEQIKRQMAGQIGSVIELLQGQLSKSVMQTVTRPVDGLLPVLEEIHKTCNCYDWADVCAHLAAVLYGVGVRLDDQPELLFSLRGVDHRELIAAVTESPLPAGKRKSRRTIAAENVGAVFGIEMGDGPDPTT